MCEHPFILAMRSNGCPDEDLHLIARTGWLARDVAAHLHNRVTRLTRPRKEYGRPTAAEIGTIVRDLQERRGRTNISTREVAEELGYKQKTQLSILFRRHPELKHAYVKALGKLADKI